MKLDLASFALGLAAGVGATLVAITIWRSRFAAASPRAEGLRAHLRDVRKGGLICLGGFGDDGDDLHLFIDGYARCERGKDTWHELEGDYRGRRVGLEWREVDGNLRVVAFNKRRVDAEPAKLDPAALERAEKTPGTAVEVEGVPYRLEGQGEALRHDGGHGAGVPLRTWELVDAERRAFVRVVKEKDGAPRVSLGKLIAADAVEIYRVKAE